jgi:hypothetical protein
MNSLLLALTLCGRPALAADAAPTGKEIEAFVKADLGDLRGPQIERMMAVDEKAVPPKLLNAFQGRKLQLNTLRRLMADRKKGTIRTPEKNCGIPDDAKSDNKAALRMAKYEDITDDEERMLEEQTHCTERDMMCEFSLQIILKRDPKTKKVVDKEYMLHPKDPLFALVAAYRSRKSHGNTPFFGQGQPVCSH